MRRQVLPAVLLLALGACGQQADLKPKAGQDLPPPPYGREDRPKAKALLQVDPQAAPERSVELRKRSEDRTDDPFDLPPSDE
ncbi:hypothetical protein RQP55_07840 [Novosphingobium sp. APW14]|jgi:hypothetical protein|uniref:hypothetical protein n=1 Tax=Novosphingobium sp. APW14 TaxID=3077237 RepID=UPI0028DD8D42|nr:hypothetical protein [Novosphingobium sp. APW14]MDT9013331.1 hypothetical protein [Novosphingobium sp. APW14]